MKDLSAGRERSAVVLDDGRLLAWGNIRRERVLPADVLGGGICVNMPFRVGHNRFADPRPGCLNPGLAVSRVEDGFASSLAVTADGRAVSFRPVLLESEDRSAAAEAVFAAVPGHVAQVAVAENANFALRADGEVWSWGPGEYGVLGRSAVVPLATPGQVRLPVPVARLVAGYAHVLALDVSGTVWSWGANGAGQLGLGDLRDRAGPARLMLPVRIRRIAAGHTHSFALDEADRLWAWGSNNFGQLGVHALAYSSKPVRIDLPFRIHELDAGMHFSLAASTYGDVFAWGWNGRGQLARDDLAASPSPLKVPSLRDITRISAGVTHALAAADSSLHAWGDNRSAACGVQADAQVQHRPTPVPLA